MWKFGFLKDYVNESKCNFIKSVTPLCYGFEKHMCLFENLAWQIIVNGFAFQHSSFLSFLPKDQCFERFDAQLTFLKWRALISAFCRLIFLLNASFPYCNLIWGGQNIYVHTLNELYKLSCYCQGHVLFFVSSCLISCLCCPILFGNLILKVKKIVLLKRSSS